VIIFELAVSGYQRILMINCFGVRLHHQRDQGKLQLHSRARKAPTDELQCQGVEP